MATYREGLNTIESLYLQLHSTRRERSAILSHLEDISEVVDELRGGMNELEDKAKTFQDLLKRVEQRLQDLGADEIRERIQNVIKRLNALPDEIETCIKHIITLTRNLDDYAQKILEHERDLAMYIPLFSAAYSRYSDARPDAPRIISLDEAFAGVDENNIRDMFDLLEKLGFNYIMNSQAL